MFNEKKPNTIEELITFIDDVVLGIRHIGGREALNDYGRGQYDMMERLQSKFKAISDSKKASKDASSDDEKLEA